MVNNNRCRGNWKNRKQYFVNFLINNFDKLREINYFLRIYELLKIDIRRTIIR